MFASIKGKVELIDDNKIVISTNGIGYEVFTTANVINKAQEHQDIFLHIQTIVKEDSISLYGFSSIEDKNIFNMLIKVQGIGSKMAINALATLSANDIINAIILEDTNIISTIPGVGKKLAIRVINELKTLVKNFNITTTNNVNKNIEIPNDINKDAILALQSLGYNYFESQKAVNFVLENNKEDSLEDIIKKSLQYLSKG